MFKKKDYTNRTNITASENLSLKRTLFVNKTLTKHPYRIAMRNSCFGNFRKFHRVYQVWSLFETGA